MKADDCMGQFEPDEILGMTGVQHLFDAYVVGLFGRIWNDHEACEVRLVDDRFPDAQLRDPNCLLEFEVTLADEKDRRMALEHKLLREKRERGEIAAVPINPEDEKRHALEAIPRRCAEKAKKYCGAPNSNRQARIDLLLYVNFPTVLGPVVCDQEIAKLTKPWKHNFHSIWLLYGARIIRPWPTWVEMRAQSDPIG